mmetsp:Transcript_54788/g.91317  ORF Transcript_54788/g.91317 Transcript_54788/m.91317 type:complete len:168 (-) Transcript_54788:201-704(-)
MPPLFTPKDGFALMAVKGKDVRSSSVSHTWRMWDAECRLRQKQAQLAQTPHPPAQGARTRALETQRRWDGLLRHQMLELAGQWRSRAQELQCAVQKQEASGSVREELQQEVMAIMGQVRVLEEECAKMQAMAQEGQGGAHTAQLQMDPDLVARHGPRSAFRKVVPPE